MKHLRNFLLATFLTVQFSFAFGASPVTTIRSKDTVVFVCEHGNVKSLMAASYFNEIARERGLPFVAIARGTAPNSTTVPSSIVAGLRTDGVDVSTYRPLAINAQELVLAKQVVLIETSLPHELRPKPAQVLDWNDVPPASVNFEAARESLKGHVDRLVSDLIATPSN